MIPVSNLRRVSYISANSIQGRHGRLLAGKISTVATSLLLPLPLFCKIQARPLHCLISHGDPGILPITLSFFENFPVKRFYSWIRKLQWFQSKIKYAPLLLNEGIPRAYRGKKLRLKNILFFPSKSEGIYPQILMEVPAKSECKTPSDFWWKIEVFPLW